MSIQLSRRAFLAAAGGGVLAVGSAAVLWRSGSGEPAAQGGDALVSQGFVDQDGWMLTADEQQKVRDQLAAPAQVEIEAPPQ